MQTLPQFKVLQRGEQPPDEGYHVLLVHRFSSDWRALVHDITGRVPPSAGKVCHLTGRNAFTGTPGRPCGPLIRWRPSAGRRSCMYETTLDCGNQGSTPKHEACDRSGLSGVPWRNAPTRCQN